MAAVEPGFPVRGFQAAPVFDVLVDDDELAAGLEDAGEFGDGAFNIDSVLEAFRGVDEIESVIGEGVLGEGSAAGEQGGFGVSEHGEGEIEGNDAGLGVEVLEDAGEAAFAGAGIEGQPGVHVAEVAGDELHVIYAGIDGRGEMLFVAGGGLKARADLGKSNGAGAPGGAAAPQQFLEEIEQGIRGG